MKKNTIIAFVAVFICTMLVPQTIVAKEKKVKYLGHTYKGSVDSNNTPNGNGVMNVGGVLIEGIFDSNSATEAEVCKVKYQEESQLAVFYGTITFDESENITLKAGGKMVTYYYPKTYCEISERKEMTEVLSEDRIVNSDNFEPNEIKISYTIKPTGIDRELNPPTEATGYYALKLQKFSLKKSNYEFSDFMAFVDLSDKEKETEMKIVNYKDGEGRIWNWENKMVKSNSFPRLFWSVVYPDGSYFKFDSSKDQPAFFKSWKIRFSDGKTVEYKPTNQDQFGCLALGNSFFLINHGLNDAAGFMKLKSLDKLCFSKEYPEFGIYSNYYDFVSLSSQEGEKLIKEHVLPYLKSESAENTVYIKVKSGNNMGDGTLGIFKDGKYLSEAERKAKEKEADEKEFKRNYAQACKMYGKTYVDAALKGQVIVGMPEKLFLSIFTNCKLHAKTAEGKLYYVYSYATRTQGRKEWLAEVLSKEVIVYNGKVAKILNHR